jgi:hypothetical protein
MFVNDGIKVAAEGGVRHAWFQALTTMWMRSVRFLFGFLDSPKNGADRFFRNFGKKLPLHAAYKPKIALVTV